MKDDFGDLADAAYMSRPDEGEAKIAPAMPYNEAANGGRWWEQDKELKEAALDLYGEPTIFESEEL